jgi:hypothetical protein
MIRRVEHRPTFLYIVGNLNGATPYILAAGDPMALRNAAATLSAHTISASVYSPGAKLKSGSTRRD